MCTSTRSQARARVHPHTYVRRSRQPHTMSFRERQTQYKSRDTLEATRPHQESLCVTQTLGSPTIANVVWRWKSCVVLVGEYSWADGETFLHSRSHQLLPNQALESSAPQHFYVQTSQPLGNLLMPQKNLFPRHC